MNKDEIVCTSHYTHGKLLILVKSEPLINSQKLLSGTGAN